METIFTNINGFFVIAGVLVGALSTYVGFLKNRDYMKEKANEPFKVIEKKIDESSKKTQEQFDTIQQDINFVIKAVSAMCEHMATGNDIDKMKKLHNEITDYLIETRRG